MKEQKDNFRFFCYKDDEGKEKAMIVLPTESINGMARAILHLNKIVSDPMYTDVERSGASMLMRLLSVIQLKGEP